MRCDKTPEEIREIHRDGLYEYVLEWNVFSEDQWRAIQKKDGPIGQIEYQFQFEDATVPCTVFVYRSGDRRDAYIVEVDK